MPGIILKSCPISEHMAIIGTIIIQKKLCFEILLSHIINANDMYEKSQRPSGKEYKIQSGILSAKGSV